MKKLRMAVVGVGYLGEFHAEKYSKMENVDLIGVVDTDLKRANEIANKIKTKAFSDFHTLLGKVDAVSIAVPTPSHYSISKSFLEQGVDVLIEKPMTTTIEEADELIRIAEKKNRIIQVGHLERYNPAVVAIRDTINHPMFIESHRLSTYKGRCTDVSVVLDLMIHDIDIILNFVGSNIKSTHAAGIPVISEHVDIANARIEFESGCVANVTASRISMKNERKIRLFQKDAYVSVDFANQAITIIKQNGEKGVGLIPGMEIENMCIAKGDALKDELISFVESVKTRQSPEVSGKTGRAALRTALNIMAQINQSAKRFLK